MTCRRERKSGHSSTHALCEVHVLGGVAGAACVGRQAQHISQACLQRIYIGAGKRNAVAQFVAATSNHTLGVSGSTRYAPNHFHPEIASIHNEHRACEKKHAVKIFSLFSFSVPSASSVCLPRIGCPKETSLCELPQYKQTGWLAFAVLTTPNSN